MPLLSLSHTHSAGLLLDTPVAVGDPSGHCPYIVFARGKMFLQFLARFPQPHSAEALKTEDSDSDNELVDAFH